MNWDEIKGSWKELRGRARERRLADIHRPVNS